jgi:hypothetical protein
MLTHAKRSLRSNSEREGRGESDVNNTRNGCREGETRIRREGGKEKNVKIKLQKKVFLEFTVDDAIKERAGKVRLNVVTVTKNGT